jgi:hypothetical protein
MNIGNYHLTETGIMYRASAYWDELQHTTQYLNQISERLPAQTFYRLSTGFVIAFLMCFIPISQFYFVFFIGIITISSLASTLQLLAHFLLFKKIRKKGNLIYDTLEKEYKQLCSDFPDEANNMDYEMALEYYQLAKKFPIYEVFYMLILAFMPISIVILSIIKTYFLG